MIASAISALWLLLVLACPLMMIFMMRGMGHGQSGQSAHAGGCHGGQQVGDASKQQPTLDELRERLDELKAQIQELEDQQGERVTAAR